MRNNALDDACTFRLGELRDEFGMLPRVLDAGVAENFQPRALRIIHQEQADAVVGGEVAGGEHLAVAFVIGERERRRD